MKECPHDPTCLHDDYGYPCPARDDGIWMETEEQGSHAKKPQRSDLRKVTISHGRVSAWLYRQLVSAWYSPLVFAACLIAVATLLLMLGEWIVYGQARW